jgi:transcriptional regulator with XRE-family HTH domain
VPTVKYTNPLKEPEFDEREALTPDILKRVFRARVLKLMQQKEWTQAELGRRSELPRDFISTYLRDPPRSMPTPLNVMKIARALGVKPTDLVPQMGDASDVMSPIDVVGGDVQGIRVRINVQLPDWAYMKIKDIVLEVVAAQASNEPKP